MNKYHILRNLTANYKYGLASETSGVHFISWGILVHFHSWRCLRYTYAKQLGRSGGLFIWQQLSSEMRLEKTFLSFGSYSSDLIFLYPWFFRASVSVWHTIELQVSNNDYNRASPERNRRLSKTPGPMGRVCRAMVGLCC